MKKKDLLMEIESEIEGLINEYKKMQLNAMEENDIRKVDQFTGSMISLSILEDRINYIFK